MPGYHSYIVAELTEKINDISIIVCLNWLSLKINTKSNPKGRISDLTHKIGEMRAHTIQAGLSNSASDLDISRYSGFLGLEMTSIYRPISASGAASAYINSYNSLAGLDELTEKYTKSPILLKFEYKPLPPPVPPRPTNNYAQDMPPSYDSAFLPEPFPPGYGETVGAPSFMGVYRSAGKKARGFNFPHIYFFDPRYGEFKCKASHAAEFFQSLSSVIEATEGSISSISAWKVVRTGASLHAEANDDEDD